VVDDRFGLVPHGIIGTRVTKPDAGSGPGGRRPDPFGEPTNGVRPAGRWSQTPFEGDRVARRQLARIAAPEGDTAAQLGMLAPMVSPGLASPE
jgi:hypothetical protein